MEIEAAVFRKVQEPLTIEAVEIDKPWGREVLVRTVATGVCHSDLHVVDGIGRFPLDRPIVLGHEGAGVVEAVGADVTTVKPGDHVVACLSGFCGNCPQCLSGHPNLCTGGIVTRPDNAAPAAVAEGPAVPPVHRHFELCREDAAAREFDREDRPRTAARPGGAGRLRRVDRGRRGVAQLGARGGADRRGVRLRRGRAVDHPGRADRRRPPDHRRRHVRLEARDGDARRRDRISSTAPRTTRSRRCAR